MGTQRRARSICSSVLRTRLAPAFCGAPPRPLELWIGHDSPEKWLERVHAYKPFVIEARGRPDLRQRILEKGIVEYLRETLASSVSRKASCRLPLRPSSQRMESWRPV